MSRSIKKGPFVSAKLLKRVEAQNKKGSRDPINTWARSSVILPDFVGHTFNVHNGRAFIKVYVTEDMVGQRLAVFAAVEVKDRGRPTEQQAAFINLVQQAGGLAGVARSVPEALSILGL